MGSLRCIFDIIGIIFVLLSLANSNPLSYADNDLLFSDSAALSSNAEELLAFNSPGSSSLNDFSSLPPLDASDSLFDDMTNAGDNPFLSSNDDKVNLDESIQLADCSSSNDLSLIGRSRITRRGGVSCTDPGANPLPISDMSDEGMSRNEWLFDRLQENHNSECRILTNDILPWGVCSDIPAESLTPVSTSVISPTFAVPVFYLPTCTLGTFYQRHHGMDE